MSHGHHPRGRAAPQARPGMSVGSEFGIGCLGCSGMSVMGFFAPLLLGATASTTGPRRPGLSRTMGLRR